MAMNIYRHKKNDKLYTLQEVQIGMVMGHWLLARPHKWRGFEIGTPDGRGQLKKSDFELVR
tara:strand:- start:667 stop:849 length:183 start_codon:yes stop_codon:yes gene_type:complete